MEYETDLNKIVDLLNKEDLDLEAKVPNGNGQTFLHEVLLAIDHTSYHIGEFAILRQVMDTWPKNHE